MQDISQTISTVPIQHYVLLCTLLFVIGVAGVLIKRNALVIFMSIEIMLNSINLLLVAFSVYHHDPAGQVFVFFVMIVAAAEVAVGLALVVMVYRHTHSIDIDFLNKLKW
jgi:NADH-quinone oxidoreductase subunit K